MTLFEKANNGIITLEMEQISELERVETNIIAKEISKGRAVLMQRENCRPIGIGSIFRTKINVNLGTSSSNSTLDEEIEKATIAQKYGADTISDLSMGDNIDEMRRFILNNTTLPITTVPIYQTVIDANSLIHISEDQILKTIEKQVKDGISSIVIHAGFSLDTLQQIKGKRIMGIVSKGGSFTASIMKENNIDNPFFKNLENILEILHERDVVLNLGNAMRSGCIHDKIDDFQIAEIKINNQLAEKANEKGIQVILESLGGHVCINDLLEGIKICRQLTNNRPLFVSGPLPVDFAVGYDHIAAAIGGAFASGHGADYLCAITPAEHLCLPNKDDIKNGLIACKIAAHVGDSIKFGLNHLFEKDLELSKNRFLKNWERQFDNCLDKEEPIRKHPINEKECSMCGNYCALSIYKRIQKKK